MSLTIAVWVIAISLLLSVFAIFVFLLNLERDLTRTLSQVDETLKKVQQNLDVISNELTKTLKNTTDITSETKSLIKNINTLTSFNMLLQPFTSNVSNKNTISRIINIAKILFGVVEGYNFYKKFLGGSYERKQG